MYEGQPMSWFSRFWQMILADGRGRELESRFQFGEHQWQRRN